MDEIEIITPNVADETAPLDHGLVSLTAAIDQINPDVVAHGYLGGWHGYGAKWENDVFLMRPFCWCEREDCMWCSEDACGCPNPDPRHFVDGVEVSDDEAWRFSKRLLGKMPHQVAAYGTPEYEAYRTQWDANVAERDRRSRTVVCARQHTCEPKGLMADRAESTDWKPSQTAPNFWHKPSGLRVWWYKWIGRDMEVIAPPDANLSAIFSECIISLPRIERTLKRDDKSGETE